MSAGTLDDRMPWCEGCDRFLNPNTLRVDGRCPSCDDVVAEPPDPTDRSDRRSSATRDEPVTVTLVPDMPESATDVPKAPWHFKLMVVAAVVYLVWRLVQLIGVVVG